MHLLAAQPGSVTDGEEAVDLGQSPGDVVYLSAADTELSCLAQAHARLPDGAPSLRLANLLHLGHNMSVDLYVDAVIRPAKIVIVRLLGGRAYWDYGVEQVLQACRDADIPVALLPGDDQPDAELLRLSTVTEDAWSRLWQYGVHGGVDNAEQSLCYAATLIGVEADWRAPKPLLRAGLYWPGADTPDLDSVRSHWRDGAPVAVIVFYRALVQAANLGPVDALIDGLRGQGMNPLPIFAASLKDPVAAALISDLLAQAPPDIILNATGFAVSAPGAPRAASPFDDTDAMVLQVVFSGANRDAWADGTRGLGARDIAMNVALPEVDGRVLTRAVSFKGRARRDAATEVDVVAYEPESDRIDFVCALTARWARLRRTAVQDRRVCLVLANYPNKDARIGNGVGLDTPAATVTVLQALRDAGYDVGDIPQDGDALIRLLIDGPTNDHAKGNGARATETLSLDDYRAAFSEMAETAQRKMDKRWATPESDPFVRDDQTFGLPVTRFGNVCVAVQPARGYNIDPVKTYHDPDLAPPHGYAAFYGWLRHSFDAHAVVHMGKHGNLEWLPGKALALSADCFPEAIFGPMPHLYPFIVNDPGEGTQAKRRTSAVIIDHLTPPLTRAESYGPLRDLEHLVDEYFEASGVDPRRCRVLRDDILSLAAATGLGVDCGIVEDDGDDDQLSKLDNYLCELKEMQIRDGLHIFGRSPTGRLLTDLLVALVRVPRGDGKGENASLHRALAADLELDFDPLDCELGTPWAGRRPGALLGDAPWRTNGDTVERLEDLAARLISGDDKPDPAWQNACAVLDSMATTVRPAVEACGDAEINGLLTGLDGRFVEPGPSGAPTRGRPDVLPTGRNFYSVDTRTVPTPAAWTLGWKSAQMLVDRHAQEHGDWPKALGLTAWGTANMRTGGDDIAQCLALMGVRPTWDAASRRVTGFEVLPVSVLGRPRVDVTLRVSGFFRDAFPGLIDLVDAAARAVAALDEPDSDNPMAARVREDAARLTASGLDPQAASFRVFGSMPGAYGAGLQALIDEKGWDTDADLSRAYVAWGGYAYGAGRDGTAAHGTFETRLAALDAVVQNQDNREHDVLDSDDYYQFQGGMTAAVRTLSGEQPAIYHNDHSRPESPKIRTLQEEIARVVRARVVNPKWIAGVMRHGYKGAFEMAATVDYLFAFAATARVVADHHFDAVFQAYLDDPAVVDFLKTHNPAALTDMAERLLEAQDRSLWTPRLNSTRAILEGLAG